MISQVQFWDRIARKYASEPIADLQGYEATLTRVQRLLRPEHSVLEVGCGTGSTALRLAPSTRCYLGTDLSREMIAIAHERLAHQPTPNLRFGVGDVTAPVPRSANANLAAEARYDLLLAFNLLHLLPDLDESLSHLLTPLKPGGLFVSKTACIGEMNWLIPSLAIAVARLLGKAPPVKVFKQEQLISALEQKGLTVEAVERHGTRGKDIRVFIVARKQFEVGHATAADWHSQMAMEKHETLVSSPKLSDPLPAKPAP